MKASFVSKKFLCAIVGLVTSLSLLLPASTNAQIKHPVKWTFITAPSSNDSEALIMCTATMEEGWHIYSQFIESGGPLPTTFTFEKNKDYTLIGEVAEEGTPVESFDPTFMMEVVWFSKSVTFIQKVKLRIPATTIKGKVEFMACTDMECLLPEVVPFSLAVKVNQPEKKKTNEQVLTPNKKIDNNDLKNSTATASPDTLNPQVQRVQETVVADSSAKVVVSSDIENPANSDKEEISATPNQSLWAIFVAGFFGGLAAILMPCIFPMIPFTVAIFSKRGAIQDGSNVLLSIIFGVSIILIYVTVGLIVSIIFGSDALNSFATNGFLNFLFFLLLVIFAASFLGAFEINLPASWVSKVDTLADREGLLSIFFVAATLVLVSFSCTGPLIGTLLVEAAACRKCSVGFGARGARLCYTLSI